MKPVLYIVVPCYKEEAVLPETSRRLKEKLRALEKAGHIAPDSRVLFVDDGSSDRTWELIAQLHEEDETFSGLKLSRNRGHQNALLAGLAHAAEHADVIISLGVRFNDRVTGRSAAKFARRAKIVHVDCDPASINKNITVDLGIIADVKELLMTVDSRIMPAAS